MGNNATVSDASNRHFDHYHMNHRDSSPMQTDQDPAPATSSGGTGAPREAKLQQQVQDSRQQQTRYQFSTVMQDGVVAPRPATEAPSPTTNQPRTPRQSEAGKSAIGTAWGGIPNGLGFVPTGMTLDRSRTRDVSDLRGLQ